MIYITGDKHGRFIDIERFCEYRHTKPSDILIILGDVSLNYYGDKRDWKAKKKLSALPITLFCIQGNHENRPDNLPDIYHQHFFHGGSVLLEDEFPNIIFAMDGEVYDFNSLKTMVIGGAYSVDKHYRLEKGWPWWPDEQPSEEIKRYVTNVLAFNGNEMDVFLTHTCPMSMIPTEAFLPGIDQSTVVTSTEQFLDQIASVSRWKKWFAGHFHINKECGKLQFLFDEITEFPTRTDFAGV